MQTTSLARQANQQMHVLSMPYLFEDHEHAAEILEGPVGNRLLNSFDSSSKLKGLAYTYSGGFMMFPVNGTVTTLADLVGQQVRSRMSHVSQETLKAFGMNPVPTEIDEVSDAVMSGNVIGAEHVAQRLLPDGCEAWVKTIIDTQHSLFLTSIVVNQDWWNSLDSAVQEIFNEAALEAARNERALSLEDGAASLKTLENNGVTVIQPSLEEMQDLRQRAESVYNKYQDYFAPGLVSSIRRH
jgi:TRAP-type C4-dicarboxylate transport system substrate-binding protein